jgi:hypothetical protein
MPDEGRDTVASRRRVDWRCMGILVSCKNSGLNPSAVPLFRIITRRSAHASLFAYFASLYQLLRRFVWMSGGRAMNGLQESGMEWSRFLWRQFHVAAAAWFRRQKLFHSGATCEYFKVMASWRCLRENWNFQFMDTHTRECVIGQWRFVYETRLGLGCACRLIFFAVCRVVTYELRIWCVILITTTTATTTLQRVIHRVPSSAFCFKFRYLLFFLRSTGSCWHRLSRLHISSVFPSVTCLRRQFVRKMYKTANNKMQLQRLLSPRQMCYLCLVP